VIHDLTGTWSGTYADGSGKPRLRLQNLQLQQLTNGAVTGRFNLESGEQCTLEKSTYSARQQTPASSSPIATTRIIRSI